MIVLSYGLTKSGSTLAFEMAKAVLELNGHPQPLLPDDVITPGESVNFVRGWTDERLARMLEATAERRIVVKTHTGPFGISPGRVDEAITAGALKLHVVYRDPRDMIVSMLDHGVKSRRTGGVAFSEIETLEDAIARVGQQLYRLGAWGAHPSLKLQYERFAFHPTYGPQAIADDLGLPADPGEVWEIVNGRFTQRNEAVPERYKTALWPEETERIERAFPLYLELVRGNDLGWFGAPTCS